MSHFYPVIIANQADEQLWPLARQSRPKQFAHIGSNSESLFQRCLRQYAGIGTIKPIVVVHENLRFVAAQQQVDVGINDAINIIEPEFRNTGAAICAAAFHLEKIDPCAIMVVSSSDQVIGNVAEFEKAVTTACEFAGKGHLVAFGIDSVHSSNRSLNEFGYLKLSQARREPDSAASFWKWVKNIDKSYAPSDYLLATNMFAFTAESILNAFQRQAFEIFENVKLAMAEAKTETDFVRLSSDYLKAPSVDFGGAVMSHVKGVAITIDCDWRLISDWKDLYCIQDHDEKGNSIAGPVINLGCENSLLYAVEGESQMVGIGLKNLVAVSTRDALLIADMDETSQISLAIAQMRQSHVKQEEGFAQVERPWGTFETLRLHDRYRVKSIVVKPGQKLSLQSHVHRAEHWVVVEGTAKVTIDDETRIISENQSIYIALGQKHRLENPGKLDLNIIEIQTGGYLEEDDIIRYEDIYERV